MTTAPGSGRPALEDGGADRDAGALTTAVVAAGAAFMAQPGDWTFLSVILGIAFLLVLLAYHRPRTGRLTVQSVVVRAAFAGTAALSLGIAVGYPIQLAAEAAGLRKPDEIATDWISWGWFPAMLVIFWVEPQIVKALMRRAPKLRRHAA
ncbi:hypothetical protein [Sinomonas terrae]|uniref:Uncharacterized protein n=1 Tax=Sinomonas terrae TaxID=2908838 RepID=A0ABS9U3Y5_9MICC|nr:hypothetical protein [Sinomonas terrae]MCH6471414.1 hypothetical protein [Sinomonas terrae]